MISKAHATYDEEIDIFELIETIWDGKWLITTFTVIALLVGSGTLFFKKSAYESHLLYSLDNFYGDEKKLYADFEKNFYSIDIFDEWKKSVGGASLDFEDFSDRQVVDGFVYTKDKNETFENELTEEVERLETEDRVLKQKIAEVKEKVSQNHDIKD